MSGTRPSGVPAMHTLAAPKTDNSLDNYMLSAKLEAMSSAIPDLKILHDLGAAVAVTDPERRRLLDALGERADSATGLARRLGDSRQRLNYHLKALEEAGVVEEQEQRRRGNCVERVLRPTARRFLVDPGVAGAGEAAPAAFGDRFSAGYLVALAARVIRDVGRLWSRSGATGKRLATAGLDVKVSLASPADFEAFVADLSEAVSTVIRKHHAPGGESRPFQFVAGLYPAAAAGPGKGAGAPVEERDG